MNSILLTAIAGGMLCTILNHVTDDVFEVLILKRYTTNFREVLSKYLISIFTTGILLSVIFYAFVLKENNPLQTIAFFTVTFGLIAPILSKLLMFAYIKVFQSKK